MQKLPQVVSKLHNELIISVKKLTKVVVGKDETGMSQQVSCIHSYLSNMKLIMLQDQSTESKALEASLQDKIVKEKQKYSDLLRKYEELLSSLSLGNEVQTELTKLQLTMENVNISLEKVEAIKKYWSDKVTIQLTTVVATGVISKYVCMYICMHVVM